MVLNLRVKIDFDMSIIELQLNSNNSIYKILLSYYLFSLFEGFITLLNFEVLNLLNLLSNILNLSTLTASPLIFLFNTIITTAVSLRASFYNWSFIVLSRLNKSSTLSPPALIAKWAASSSYYSRRRRISIEPLRQWSKINYWSLSSLLIRRRVNILYISLCEERGCFNSIF